MLDSSVACEGKQGNLRKKARVGQRVTQASSMQSRISRHGAQQGWQAQEATVNHSCSVDLVLGCAEPIERIVA